MVVLVIFSLSAVQYSNDKVDPEVYLKEYQQHREKFTKRQTIENIRYSVQVIPNELKLIHLDKLGVVTEESISEFSQKTANTLECLFQIDLLDYNQEFLTYPFDDSMSYNARLEYYSFKMKEDISILIDGASTLQCNDYVFERNFGFSPKATITLGFNIPERFKTIEIIINDRVFKNDNIRFEFNSNDLNILPKLKKYNKWKS